MRHRPSPLVPSVLLAAVAASCGGGSSSEDLAAADLDGRTFVATSVEGHTIVTGSEIVLSFDSGSIVIEAGCNTQRGGYEIVGGALVVDQLATTMMACDEALMDQDAFVGSLLASSPPVELDGDDLVIGGEGSAIGLTQRS